jgi:hypothetical protein
MIRGLKEVACRGLTITSIGIDTWGVDFVFIGDDGAILRNPMAQIMGSVLLIIFFDILYFDIIFRPFWI